MTWPISRRQHLLLWVIVATSCLLAILLRQSQHATGMVFATQKIDPGLMAEVQSNDRGEFLVYLLEQADLSHAASLPRQTARGRYVYEQLTAVAQRTQPAVIEYLVASGVPFRRFWITNMVWVNGDSETLLALAQRDDVARIEANRPVRLQPPDIAIGPTQPAAVAGVEWNIQQVNTQAVWDLGFTGQGVVVGVQDTGFDWNHPALINQYRGWTGSIADHDYNWHDAIHEGGGICGADSAEPCDDHGHGTHVLGTVVANDLAGSEPGWPASAPNALGMAPGARWIGCRNMDSGTGTPATYAECYQWFVAPYPIGGNPFTDGDPDRAPHVINNSWVCPPQEGCTDPEILLKVVQNVRAAGILTVHAAGNNGNSCSSIADPAAIYDESFTVGAVDKSDKIHTISGRGPVLIDGSNRRKPDITAPGVNIRSTIRGGRYQGGWTGTSMAAPHVTGLVALLISAEPALAGQAETLTQIIEQSAVPRTTSQGCGGDSPTAVPNNVYGHGRIDAEAAVQRIGTLQHSLSVNLRASKSYAIPGQLLHYDLSVSHFDPLSSTYNVVISDVIPGQTTFVTATMPHTKSGGLLEWHVPELDSNGKHTVTLTLRVNSPAASTIDNNDYGVRSQETPTAVLGVPLSIPVLDHQAFLPKFPDNKP